ncbi:MAG: beta-agarase [Bacteroidota bacterium]
MRISSILKASLLLLLAGGIGVSQTAFQTPQNSGVDDPFWEGRKQKLLLDFEKSTLPDSISFMSAEGQTVDHLGVSNGAQAMEMHMQKDVLYSGFRFKPASPIDASDFKNFALVFDATNTTLGQSLYLYVNVYNDKGQSIRRAVALPSGKTVSCFFELAGAYLHTDTGLRDDPTPWKSGSIHMKVLGVKTKIDFSTISEIRFYAQHTTVEKNVILDQIRLVETPPKAKDYLEGIVDEFGQNAKAEFPGKIKSEAQLKGLADAELALLEAEGTMADRSSWGDWKSGPKLEATGFFRTEKYNGKWALVDPDGHLFFSTGIANVRMANTTSFTGIDFKNDTVRYRDPEDVTPEDSRGMVALSKEVTETAYIAYPFRRKMFQWLPEYNHPLANHFSYRRESHMGPFAHGETFSFYQANLERRYGEATPGAHLEAWRNVTIDRFKNWGFTSFGNWVAVELYEKKKMPYFANGWIIGDFKTVKSGLDYWGPMPDVFDPEFARRVDVTVKVVGEEVKNSPWCIGVFIDNEKSWGIPNSVRGQYGIPLHALMLSAKESPIKAEFIRRLKSKYKKVDTLNTAWNTSIKNWKTLEAGMDFRDRKGFSEDMVADMSDMLEAYATRYFKLVHDAVEREMPNHLYLGCRFASWGMGPEVRNAAKKFVDVFSYNYYKEAIGETYWKFLEEIDRPSIIGEFHIGTQASGLFHPGLIHAVDQADRGRMYATYMRSVIDNPYFVGAHWFQYLDSPLSGRAHDGENYNVGFVTNTDVPYPEMVQSAKEVNRELYTRRFGKK